MKIYIVFLLVLLFIPNTNSVSYGLEIDQNNLDGIWEQKYDTSDTKPPFSFVYGGRFSNELLKDWHFKAEHKKLDENRKVSWYSSAVKPPSI